MFVLAGYIAYIKGKQSVYQMDLPVMQVIGKSLQIKDVWGSTKNTDKT